MRKEIYKYIGEELQSNKLNFEALIPRIAKKFQIELQETDKNDIQLQYRKTAVDLWCEEVLECLKEKIESHLVDDDKVIELLEIFCKQNAFDKVPVALQGDYYKMIHSQIQLFGLKDFEQSRRKICDFLTIQINHFEVNVRNDFEFYKTLMEVAKNSYVQFKKLCLQLELKEFVNDEITLQQLAQNITDNNFTIEKYSELKIIARKITNKSSIVNSLIKRDIQKCLADLKIEEIISGDLKILKLEKKLMMSNDLDQDIPCDVKELHIICDILHIDQDLSPKYREKNVLVVSNTIQVHTNSVWDMSGYDAVENADVHNGIPGGSGGNCEISCIEIINSDCWTIKSNGGRGSNGKNGENGADGLNGHDVQESDFEILNQKVNSNNFVELANMCGISTEIGSRRKDFYENGFEKTVIFNRNSLHFEMLILLKGSKGKIGEIGGRGGSAGMGGHAGKINVRCNEHSIKTVTINGADGSNGSVGSGGFSGRDGYDGCMKISSRAVSHFQNQKYMEIIRSTSATDCSIYYEPLKKYLAVKTFDNLKSSTKVASSLRNVEKSFFETLFVLLRNAGESLQAVIRNWHIKQFVDQTISFKLFACKIIENPFDILSYNELKSLGKNLSVYDITIENQIREVLKIFIAEADIQNMPNDVLVIKKKLLTSEDLNSIIRDFRELHVVCDTLHFTSKLSEKFRGRNLLIAANIICVHKSIDLNVSGVDYPPSMDEISRVNGGNVHIRCTKLKNPSLLSIKSNGRDAKNATNGIDAQMKDFQIEGQKPEELPAIKKSYVDEGLTKHFVKQSDSNFLLIVKGTSADGMKFGFAGHVEIKSQDSGKEEVDVIAKDGEIGTCRDGRDAVLLVKNGIRSYLGLDQLHKYELASTFNPDERSINFLDINYYPRFSRVISNSTGIDDLELGENIIWMMRDSKTMFDAIATKLQIHEFSESKISLQQLAQNIKNSNLDIGNFSDVQKCALEFTRSIPLYESVVRNRIKKFFEPSEMKSSGDILTIKRVFIKASELLAIDISSSIRQIQIICDTLFIDSKLPQAFRGINLAILANHVDVISKVKWNLSGCDVQVKDYPTDAGQHEGKGLDGADGNAGKSGGHFALRCKSIENSSALTIISNGSDGTNGQNGGNGSDGANGKDAQHGSFFLNGTEWRMKTWLLQQLDMMKKVKGAALTDDGLKYDKTVYKNYLGTYISIMIVFGSDGQPGKSGGLPGFGGQGGFAGEILIDGCANSVTIVRNPGRDGVAGTAGMNGAAGREGRDMYRYDWSYKTEPDTFGGNTHVKYKKVWNNSKEPNVYCEQAEKYFHVAVDHKISFEQIRTRNDSKVTRNRSHMAVTNSNVRIEMNRIEAEYSKYLNASINDVQLDLTGLRNMNKSASYLTKSLDEYESYIQTNFQEISNMFSTDEKRMKQQSYIEASKNTDILAGLYIPTYSDCFKTSVSAIQELTQKYQDLNVDLEVEIANTKMKTTTSQQVKSKLQRISKRPNESKQFHGVVKELKSTIEAKKLWIMIRSSHFEASKYSYLQHVMGSLNVKTIKRNFIDNEYFMDIVLKKFKQKHDIKQFQEESLNSQEFSEYFINHVKSQCPAFLIDFFKNSIRGSVLDIDDLIMICNEKVSEQLFHEVYWKMIRHDAEVQLEVSTASVDENAFLEQAEFLKVMEDSSLLNRHLILNGNVEKMEVLEYFIETIQDSTKPLAEDVFNLLYDYSAEIVNISDIVDYYGGKLQEVSIYDESDEDNEAQELLCDKESKKMHEILQNFFKESRIESFIRNEITEQGNQSKLYRRIVSHMYRLKLILFARNFDGDLRIIETHNFDNRLQFKYENETESPQELLAFVEDEKIYPLVLEMKKYKIHLWKKQKNAGCENFIKCLTQNENVPEYLMPIVNKFKPTNYKILNFLEDNDMLVDNEILIHFIMKSIPYIVKVYDDDATKCYEATDEVLQEIFNSNKPFKIEEDQKLRETIKVLLEVIGRNNGQSVLKALALRLFNENFCLNIRQFSLILQMILELIDAKHFLTFMLLSNTQEEWAMELGIIKLQSLYSISDVDITIKWRKMVRKLLKGSTSKIFQTFLHKISEMEMSQDVLSVNDLNEIFENLKNFDIDHLATLSDLDLLSWRSIITETYWKKALENLRFYKNTEVRDNFDELKVTFEHLNLRYGVKAKELLKVIQAKKKELHNLKLVEFLQNFKNGEWLLSDKTLELLNLTSIDQWNQKMQNHRETQNEIQTVSQIITLIESDDETSSHIKRCMTALRDQMQKITKVVCPIMNRKILELNELEVKEWIKTNKNPSIIDALAIVIRSIELLDDLILRDTQIISILTMWNSQNGVLMQVSTGEGKTLIGVAFAILKALQGEKIDIITSSSVLAIRDAEENRKYFDFFNISVDHNCHEDTERRKEAYKKKVVYGILGNFQRDYLLTEFFDENFMSGHHFSNVLVDEVDSMLLDKGNNILYLSSEIPDIDEIESIFVFIWQYLNQISGDPALAAASLEKEVVRKVVLDNIYGILEEDDIIKMGLHSDADKVINNLKKHGILDEKNAICSENYSELKIDEILDKFQKDLRNKINFFIKSKIEAKKLIEIPRYLKKFLYLHLDKWIESGIRALMVKDKREYRIDRSKNNPDLTAGHEIIILDLDTGTDMTNSQWGDGLHQFLQLKHGCKLTQISLKSVFISNVSYFKRYEKLYGMTGTLGGNEERKKTTEMYGIDYVTVPRFKHHNFTEYTSLNLNDPNNWLDEIHKEVTSMFYDNRSVLIVGETIELTDDIRKKLLSDKEQFSYKNVHVYQKDTDRFDISVLQTKHVIIATNLAGRGTDIRLSKELKNSGGLHVILSYLPNNSRIENQAFGRAARAGNKGSGRLIIYSNNDQPLSQIIEQRNSNELERLNDVNKYYKNFIKIEEMYFDKFLETYKMYKNEGKSEVELTNFKLQWSFWLDENGTYLDNWKTSNGQDDLERSFKTFIKNKSNIHPVKRIEMFKEKNNKKEFQSVSKLLNEDFYEDSIAYNYYNCYVILKSKQESNKYAKRDLTTREQRELLKCMKMLENRIQNRSERIEIIKMTKVKYQKSLIPLDGYEKQQEILNEIDEMFVDSIKSILGYPVTPDKLRTAQINNEALMNDVYEEMIANDCITAPKISRIYTEDDVKVVAKAHNMKFEDLNKFLESNKDVNIPSLKKFGEEIKWSFKMPSREEFWEVLVQKGILMDEVEYAVLDLNTLRYVDPSIHEILSENNSKFSSKSLEVTKNSEIFLTSVSTLNGNSSKFIMSMEELKSYIAVKRFRYLMDNDVIQIVKKADFNIKKFKELQNSKIFNNFDEIRIQDFEDISSCSERVIAKLTKIQENGQSILVHRGNNCYSLNYPGLSLIDLDSKCDILSDDFVYQESIYRRILYRFSYRICLEHLADSIEYNIQNGTSSAKLVIHLDTTPHLKLISNLILNHILEASKANSHKIIHIDKVINSFKSRDAETFIGSSQPKSSSSTYFRNHETKGVLMSNWKLIEDERENIEKLIKNLYQDFWKEELTEVDVVLKPLDDFFQNEYQKYAAGLGLMKNKGFDLVIKVELKRYSSKYWWNFSILLIMATVQITIGAAFIVLSYGVLAKVGQVFINEGIGDAVYALNTLKSGTFNWKSYREHKIVSVITSVVFCGVQVAASKTKYINKFFSINSNSTFSMELTKSLKYDQLQSAYSIIRANPELTKYAFKEIGLKILESAGKAVVQTAIGAGADYVIEKFLDDVSRGAGEAIVNALQSGFMTHALAITIADMHEYFSSEDIQNLVKQAFTKMTENWNYYTNIVGKVSAKIDELIQSGEGISKSIGAIASIVSKVVDLASVNIFTLNVFNTVNQFLREKLNSKDECQKLKEKPSNEDIEHTQQAVLEYIKNETTERYKNTINSSIVKPCLTYAGHAVVDSVKSKVWNVIATHYEEYKEKCYREEAAEIAERTGEDGNLSVEDTYRLNKILQHTKDPILYALIMKQDVPMNSIALEAAAEVVKQKLGGNRYIEIEFKGRKICFGDPNAPGAEKIELQLQNNHFENSKTGQAGNNCLYNALIDKVPELADKLSSKDFRESVSNQMLSNDSIRKEIQSSSKKYFMEVGFYGGRSIQNNDNIQRLIDSDIVPDENIKEIKPEFPKSKTKEFGFDCGNYDDMNKKYFGRRGIADAHHMPSLAAYKDIRKYEHLNRNNTPTMLIPKELHDMLSSTGRSKKATNYRNEQSKLLKNGMLAEAVLMDFEDLAKKALQYHEKIQSSSNINNFFSIKKDVQDFKNELGSTMEKYVENIYNSKLITQQQKLKLMNFTTEFKGQK